MARCPKCIRRSAQGPVSTGICLNPCSALGMPEVAGAASNQASDAVLPLSGGFDRRTTASWARYGLPF
eukprot:12445247-Alexandrium_andersonii.AAC.1